MDYETMFRLCWLIYLVLLFYILFLSKFLHVLCCSILLWPSSLLATPRGSVMLDCGFSPLMSSLSDKNMRLGDVLLPPGGKQRCLHLRVQRLFTLLVNVMGPRSIFPPLFTPSVYFLLLLSVAVTITFLPCVWSFVNSKARWIDNPSELAGSKVICCRVQVQVNLATLS